MMGDTKQKILDVSLDLFSQKGFSAVSIRDICAQVNIKESSVYYHFKNKQAIFDELLHRFEQVATDMMVRLEQSLSVQSCSMEKPFYQTVCDTFFENYFMDDFCNKIMRLLLIEQFGNSEVQKIYDCWMFEKPLEFQSKVFYTLMEIGILSKTDSEYLAVKYYAPIYFFAQRWLFSGELSEEQKNLFKMLLIIILRNFLQRWGWHNV
ncbi:MAG: TetR/AcrR family transcriptional regulator [Candidatus Limousia pullorum]|nr:TetR/AcrR family transcriptional regulator [Candidatus Limousia pullorum]